MMNFPPRYFAPLLLFSLSLLLPFSSGAFSVSSPSETIPQTVTLAYVPVSAAASSSSPAPFAVLTRAQTTSTSLDVQPWSLTSFTPPTSNLKLDYVRVGILPSDKNARRDFAGGSTLAAFSVLAEPRKSVIRLVLDGYGADASVVSVSVGIDALAEYEVAPKESAKGKEAGWPKVAVQMPEPQPRAVLNKPVILNAEGKLPPEERPKTFLEKYWWIIAGVMLFSLLGGGGGEEK